MAQQGFQEKRDGPASPDTSIATAAASTSFIATFAAPLASAASFPSTPTPSLSSLPFPTGLPSLSPQASTSTSNTAGPVACIPPIQQTSRSRQPSRAPSPIRTLSSASRTIPTATSAVNATGSSFSSRTVADREATASQRQQDTASTQSLRAHQEEIDASPRGRLKPPPHSRSQSAGPNSSTKVVMLQVSQQQQPGSASRAQLAARRSMSHHATPVRAFGDDAEPRRRPLPDEARHGAEEREKERQKAKSAAAAKLAEQEAWEKTRGAGSDVLGLLSTSSSRQQDERGSDSNDSNLGDKSDRSSDSCKSSSASSPGEVGASGRTSLKAKKKLRDPAWHASDVLPTFEELQTRRHEPSLVSSADKLLSRGISEYTLLPRILGRGKFSSVFLASKPTGPNGEPQLFAVKHTPLFPHHPLIATRLLREPTLLAELPPHPNLVTVNETIRTPGHFYLVEEYLEGYVTLEALLTMRNDRSPPQLPCLPTGVANCVLDQLLAAVSAIHHPLQICHRDIKPENILVHPDTLQLKLLDFGLATHYSKSEPKLTTCCGSPAFHCPEIVTALRNPQGAVRYWGPEVDAWTCGITMLRVLTGVRYPIGASHTSVRSMAIRAQRAISTIRDPELRDRVGRLLDCNGETRMRNLQQLVSAIEQEQGEAQRGRKDFKSTTFVPTTPQHTIRLPLVVGPAATAAIKSSVLPCGRTPAASNRTSPSSSRAPSPLPNRLHSSSMLPEMFASPSPSLILSNPECQPPPRVLSFIKYCLRCAGILYHCWPDTSASASPLTPTTPVLWETQFADLHEKALSGLLSLPSTGGSVQPDTGAVTGHEEGGGDGFGAMSPPSVSPTTPFPVQAERPERDPFLHVHIFECVLELVEEAAEKEASQPTLVQTIMSALSFGRRPAGRRSLSTPPKSDKDSQNSAKPRPGGMPAPPGQTAETTASGSGGPSGKSGDIECLRFYLVVRFPRSVIPSSRKRPGYSRSSSRTADLGKSRSRASSNAGLDRFPGKVLRTGSVDNLALLGGAASNGTYADDGYRTSSRRLLPESNGATPKASRASSPNVSLDVNTPRGGASGRAGKPRGRSTLDRESSEGVLSEAPDLTVETSPELLRRAAAVTAAQLPTESESAPTSRQSSRAPSRSRKRSRVRSSTLTGSSKRSLCNKVFVHVTDERALDAVRKALSVGGTTEDFVPDVQTDPEGPPLGNPSLEYREVQLDGSSEAPEASRQGDEQRRQRPSIQRAITYTGEAARSQRPRSVTSVEDIARDRLRQQRADWALQPTGSRRAPEPRGVGDDDSELTMRGRRPGIARLGHSYGEISDSPGSNDTTDGGIKPSGAIAFPSRRARAPSQLSAMVVPEESPSKSSTLSQAVEQLAGGADHGPGGEAGQPGASEVHAGASEQNLESVTKNSVALTEEMESSGDLSADFILRAEKQLADFLDVVERSRGAGPPSLSDQLDPLAFEAFKGLSPWLGFTQDNGQPAALHERSVRLLSVLGEAVSPRELYMAVDLRCNALMDANIVRGPPPARQTAKDAKQLYWSPAAETLGLIGLLSIVVPRIKTRKPHSFSSIFALLPGLIASALRDLEAVSREASRAVAWRTVQACCVLELAVAEWEARSIGGAARPSAARERAYYKLSQEALAPFLAAISTLLPYLQGNNETGLAEAHFQRCSPRYKVTRAEDGVMKPATAEEVAEDEAAKHPDSAEIAATWDLLAKTIADLEIDLASVWSSSLRSMGHASIDGGSGGEGAATPDEDQQHQSQPQPQAEDTAGRLLKSTLAVGGFVLHINLLARGLGRDEPSTWTPPVAHIKLEQGLPMLLLALDTEMKRASSTSPSPLGSHSPSLEDQREGMLSSTSLLWLLWCMDGLDVSDDASGSGSTIPESLLMGISQVLAAHMPLSPSAVARHARLKALQDLLCHHAEPDSAWRILRRIRSESPFVQVRAAAIGFVRALVLQTLKSEGRSSALQGSEELRLLLDEIVAPLSELPAASGAASEQRLDAYLSDHAASLQETLGLLYVLFSADSEGVLGLRQGERGERIRADWIVPLSDFVEGWLRFLSTEGEAPSGTGTASEATERRAEMQNHLALLEIGLERIPRAA